MQIYPQSKTINATDKAKSFETSSSWSLQRCNHHNWFGVFPLQTFINACLYLYCFYRHIQRFPYTIPYSTYASSFGFIMSMRHLGELSMLKLTHPLPAYLLKCYVVFYQMGCFIVYLCPGWMGAKVATTILSFFVHYYRAQPHMDAFGNKCLWFFPRQETEKRILRLQGENAFKLKDTTELPSRVAGQFTLLLAGQESSNFPTS